MSVLPSRTRIGSRIRVLIAMLGITALIAGCAPFESTMASGAFGAGTSDIPTALVLDGSGSMEESDVSGGSRIDAAKTAANGYIDALPAGTDLSLWSYGLSGSGSGCGSSTNLIPTSAVDHAAAKSIVDGLDPSGSSPIAMTMQMAGESLPTDRPASLVVVSDGEDTCSPPTICDVARGFQQTHPQLRIDAVGFMIDDPELNCAATTTGGLYVTADSEEKLSRRLAVSRDSELAMNSLTGRSFQGIEVGAVHETIISSVDNFPDLSSGTSIECTSSDCGSDTVIIVRWMNCDWHFTEEGNLILIDPGEESRTIDGFGVGDDAGELSTVYGAAKNEAKGEYDGDVVHVRWYEADDDLGLMWRVVVDSAESIRNIVLCKCLPGASKGSASATAGEPAEDTAGVDGSDVAAAEAPVVDANGERTEIEILDVFEDDGTVRSPYQSAVVKENNPSDVVCTSEPESGTNLHQCGQLSSGWYLGKCSVGSGSVYCPEVLPSGDVRILEYDFDKKIENSTFYQSIMDTEPLMFSERLPAAIVDMDGAMYHQGTLPQGLSDAYRYFSVTLDGDTLRFYQPPAGLLAPNGDFPLDTSAPLWTAEFATDYNADKDRRTIPINRVYYIE